MTRSATLGAFLGSLLLVSKAQDHCEDYYWTEDDFPESSQNFQALLSSKGEGDRYLNASDFTTDGDFYGKTWEDVFWSGVNQSHTPPSAYYQPLGFRYAKLGPTNDPTICLHASGVEGYKVELMVYTLTPGASLCMTDMNADAYNTQDTGAVSACDSQYIYNCFSADTDSDELDVAVYCNTNCEDGSNVHVLWRFRRSTLSWDDDREFTSENPEMWCDMIASDIEWPDAIQEAVPEEYEANDNLSSGTIITVAISSWIIGLLAMFY